MAEMKPCKLCGGRAVRGTLEEVGVSAYYTACDDEHDSGCRLYELYNIQFQTREEADAFWNTLMSDTPALRYVRIGLEMAAKKMDLAADRHEDAAERKLGVNVNSFDGAWHSEQARQLRSKAERLRSIPDADIMKEISREG